MNCHCYSSQNIECYHYSTQNYPAEDLLHSLESPINDTHTSPEIEGSECLVNPSYQGLIGPIRASVDDYLQYPDGAAKAHNHLGLCLGGTAQGYTPLGLRLDPLAATPGDLDASSGQPILHSNFHDPSLGIVNEHQSIQSREHDSFDSTPGSFYSSPSSGFNDSFSTSPELSWSPQTTGQTLSSSGASFIWPTRNQSQAVSITAIEWQVNRILHRKQSSQLIGRTSLQKLIKHWAESRAGLLTQSIPMNTP
ncbi:hypothetical protein AOQ84DRAFT_220269 [Glonium stellatum]|uniref:Uncharacterized protein n=1 Tax=Glonium stellatum TaxID=574774 RepID=A0A8E2F3N8_9PEZI|nr:hypothetical protein AOQ84DRAFT_220269 [Glonium stellatum]